MPDLASLATPEPDQTLEILMTELDPDVMAIFTREECLDAAEATKVWCVAIVLHCLLSALLFFVLFL